uniref:Putative secreted protein n=1 Tax=Ixodes ricinus TaxID=34613 RepID=A0A6B0UPS5_IXORI
MLLPCSFWLRFFVEAMTLHGNPPPTFRCLCRSVRITAQCYVTSSWCPVTSQCCLTSHYNLTLQCARGVFVTPTPPGIMTSRVIVTPRLTFSAKFSGEMYPLKYDRWCCSLKEKEQVLSLLRRL